METLGNGETDANSVQVKITSKELQKVRKKTKILNVLHGNLKSSLKGQSDKRIDFVVVYSPPKNNSELSTKDEEFESLRRRFGETCKQLGFEYEEETLDLPAVGTKTFVKLHCNFDLLTEYAEILQLELPLADCPVLDDKYLYQGLTGIVRQTFSRQFQTEDDDDYISARFEKDKAYLFEGFKTPEIMFRNSVRSLIAEHVLENMDTRHKEEIEEKEKLKRWNLSWFMHKGVFEDWFILHDESSEDPFEPQNENYINEKVEQLKLRKLTAQNNADAVDNWNHQHTTPIDEDSDSSDDEGVSTKKGKSSQSDGGKPFYYDARKDLHYRWCQPKFKLLPLFRIRNYFGEKIALYFAWTETMVITLWIPAFLGITVFIYGLVQSIITYVDFRESSTNSTGLEVTEILDIVNTAVDNELTPYYSLMICLWATVFLEMWKRRNASLKYEWDVNSFEDVEPDRPQFEGIKDAPDPFTGEIVKIFPFTRRVPRLLASFVTVVFMVSVVVAATLAVIIYRAFSSWKWQDSAFNQLILSTGLAAIMNAIAILILEQVYKILARKLTDWENHRTQTEYDDAHIIKIYSFYFVNSYTSLFYIAFIRGSTNQNGILNLGYKFTDECPNNNCMSELALQTLVLMAAKPVPKFCMDVIMPKAKTLAFKILSKFKKPKKSSISPGNDMKALRDNLMIREYLKPPLEDFTLEEYTEKTIAFGYQVLFAPSLPLGPLLALVFWLIDIRVDPIRMLWDYRRPVAYIAEDIGTWYAILEFVASVAVVVNAGVISFTSSYGKDKPLAEQLAIFLVFEHIVFAVKFLLAYLIPDRPSHVDLAIRKEHYEAQKRMLEAEKQPNLRNKISYKSPRELQEGRPYERIQRKADRREHEKKTSLQQRAGHRNDRVDHVTR